MRYLALALLALGAGVDSRDPKQWAFLVASQYTNGSSWYNYPQQASVCHAYQVLIRHGIPEENIVVMMYDDIAYNKQNPAPGTIINFPNGSDVYNGIKTDYARHDVTPRNFIKVLMGDSAAMKGIGSGRVIESGPEDTIFVNFVDHGSPGFVCFPGTLLTAMELNLAILTMHSKQKFGKMLIYIEACESGSMFRDLLPHNIPVYALTSANKSTGAAMAYWDPKWKACLGGVFSQAWMENADQVADLWHETIFGQYLLTKNQTYTSEVEEFGNPEMGHLPLATFMGYNATDEAEKLSIRNEINALNQELRQMDKVMRTMADKVIWSLHPKQTTDELLTKGPTDIKDWTRYTDLVHAFAQHCFKLGKHNYAVSYAHVIMNLANIPTLPLEDVKAVIAHVCGSESFV